MADIEIESFEQLAEEFRNSMENQFGAEFNAGNASNSFRFSYPILKNLLKKYQQLIYFFDMRDVYKAEGLWLDKLLSNFNFIRRQPSNSKTEWTTTDSVPETKVLPGTLIIQDAKGNTFINISGGTVDSNGELTIEMQSQATGENQNIEPNTLNDIVTPLAGINTGTNLEKASGGQDRESDFEFRTRFLSGRAGKSYWNINGVYKALLELDGVKSAYVDENDQNTAIDNLPPHSIHCVVEGGDSQDIAKTIFEKTDPGIERYGNTYVTIQDLKGENRTIYFSRPLEVNIEYQFNIYGTADTEEINLQIKNYIQNAGVRATLSSFQASKYVENYVDLNQVKSFSIEFRREGDSTWVNTLTLGVAEVGIGIVVV